MTSLNTVCILGKLIRDPQVRSLPSGVQLAELSVGIPENFKDNKDEWQSRMHFVDVVLWDKQAAYADNHLHKGDGVLVQGQLQFESWEDKSTGKKRSKLKVRAVRVQSVLLPQREEHQAA